MIAWVSLRAELLRGKSEVCEHDVRVFVFGSWPAKEDIGRLDIAMDDGLIIGWWLTIAALSVIAFMKEGKGFRELDVGVPNEAFWEHLLVFGVIIPGDISEVAGWAVFLKPNRISTFFPLGEFDQMVHTLGGEHWGCLRTMECDGNTHLRLEE